MESGRCGIAAKMHFEPDSPFQIKSEEVNLRWRGGIGRRLWLGSICEGNCRGGGGEEGKE